MLRKVRVDGPAERFDELLRAARHAALELDDYAIDSTAKYGWPGRGDGHAYVLVVADDDDLTSDDLVGAVRSAHENLTGGRAEWIVPGGSFVYLPDGMESEWYLTVAPLAEALHAAEKAGDVLGRTRLRNALELAIAEAVPRADRRFAEFSTLIGDFGRAGSTVHSADHPRR